MSLDPRTTTAHDHAQAAQVAGPLAQMLGGGGFSDLIGKLTAGGLGDAVTSWIGTGVNLPVSPAQITSALGSGPLASIASRLGLSTVKVSEVFASLLPHAIDHVTPEGKPPAADAPAPSVAALMARFAGGPPI